MIVVDLTEQSPDLAECIRLRQECRRILDASEGREMTDEEIRALCLANRQSDALYLQLDPWDARSYLTWVRSATS